MIMISMGSIPNTARLVSWLHYSAKLLSRPRSQMCRWVLRAFLEIDCAQFLGDYLRLVQVEEE